MTQPTHTDLQRDFGRMEGREKSVAALEAAKGLPPVAVTTASVTGAIDWQTWVYILTAFYLVLQILWLAWKAVDKFMGKDSEED